jgi:ABC-type nickel/cobalt efflux system permease component RcnA
MSKGLIGLILKGEFNQTIIDNQGQASALQRANFNTGLLYRSIWYSVACLGICIAMVVIVFLRKINVKWRKLMIEHLAFVFILGLYEYFFYETIIYKYMTISTSELNQHIIDGMYQCISN